MATTHKTIRVTDETDLSALLDDAAKAPVILERDSKRFRLSLDAAGDAIAYEPDPQGVRAMLAATAGSWADIDVDEVIADIDAARQAGSRPLDRP